MLTAFLQKYEKELYKDFYMNDIYVDVIVHLFTNGLTFIAWAKGSLRGNVLNYVINQELNAKQNIHLCNGDDSI
jgi:hypothetical protein